MNTIHQISLKLRLGIDTHANIQPEVLLEKWQDLVERKLYSGSQPRSSGLTERGTTAAPGRKALRQRA